MVIVSTRLMNNVTHPSIIIPTHSVHASLYTHTHQHQHTHHTHTHTRTRTRTRTHTRTHTHTNTNTHTNTHTHARTRTCTHTRTHTNTNTHTCTHTHTHTHTHTFASFTGSSKKPSGSALSEGFRWTLRKVRGKIKVRDYTHSECVEVELAYQLQHYR